MTFLEWVASAHTYYMRHRDVQRYGQALVNSLTTRRKDIASEMPREVDPWEVKTPHSDPARTLDFFDFVEDNWDHDELHG